MCFYIKLTVESKHPAQRSVMNPRKPSNPLDSSRRSKVGKKVCKGNGYRLCEIGNASLSTRLGLANAKMPLVALNLFQQHYISKLDPLCIETLLTFSMRQATVKRTHPRKCQRSGVESSSGGHCYLHKRFLRTDCDEGCAGCCIMGVVMGKAVPTRRTFKMTDFVFVCCDTINKALSTASLVPSDTSSVFFRGPPPLRPITQWTDNIKRKLRRRPIWGRGIIRKKKSYKKEEAEDDDEPEEEEGAEDSVAMVQDESSCDTMEPDKQPLQANGHVLSTEEENSCEPTASRDSPGEEEADRALSVGATTGEGSAAPVLKECVNGNESMDSIDSGKGTEGGGKEVAAGLGSVTGDAVEHEPAEHEETSGPECIAEENETLEEETMCDTDHEKEGSSKEKECAKGPSDGQRSPDTLEEAAQIPPPPALVVDHQRLKRVSVVLSVLLDNTQVPTLVNLLLQHLKSQRLKKRSLSHDTPRSQSVLKNTPDDINRLLCSVFRWLVLSGPGAGESDGGRRPRSTGAVGAGGFESCWFQCGSTGETLFCAQSVYLPAPRRLRQEPPDRGDGEPGSAFRNIPVMKRGLSERNPIEYFDTRGREQRSEASP
ncbi:ATPase family AAA domain-containing protein 2B [Triplophysa tibetana]|uniref:ATPase family AAA domain-containing protein 2B n=1 Tax=Triplophysa tibetana TaxID=1572043 RepID=A0A5A9NG37_9TELE|nr:ATPase family AAA domain-containing protein 2B [Triplophysa tibetana]